MLEEMVKAVVDKAIAQDYPFLKTPAVLYAVVMKASKLGDWYDYTLQVVDRWGNADESFPAFPEICSRIQLTTGAFVSVAMAYGDVPTIIAEVKL